MKMSENNGKARILIAVTELTPVQQLWDEALQYVQRSPAELLALFLVEDHWHRAASLPFTREISRMSGMDTDFTLQRARQIHDEAINRARDRMQALASQADLVLDFEVLPESEQERIGELVAGSRSILIVPSFLTTHPFFTFVQQADCRIVLIEAEEQADQAE